MKFLVLLAILAIANGFVMNHPEWLGFKQSYGKNYNNLEEERMRFDVFFKNKEMIEAHNKRFEAGEVAYSLKLNKFADLTEHEYNLRKGLAGPSQRSGLVFSAPKNLQAPETMDWRERGAVTEVKDQGGCGSCWAFSTTGSVEGQIALKTGKLVSLSEEQLVDCSRKYENAGCDGGFMDNGFKYIKDFGLMSEQDYPYEGIYYAECQYDKSKVVANVTGFVDIKSGSEDDLLMAVATVGPISVAIDAPFTFQFYHSGVYSSWFCGSSESSLDHGVLVVGYGTEDGQDYWLVKNSWGPSWGQNGYVKMARNKDNSCGIATMASYPLV